MTLYHHAETLTELAIWGMQKGERRSALRTRCDKTPASIPSEIVSIVRIRTKSISRSLEKIAYCMAVSNVNFKPIDPRSQHLRGRKSKQKIRINCH